MVTGWRKAFCTSIPKDTNPERDSQNSQNNPNGSTNRSPRFGHKFSFFSSSNSNPSTPRPETPPFSTTPTLRCRTTTTTPTSKTNKSPRLFISSTPSSPRSPSTFALLKNSLRLSKSATRCGICLQNVKTGQGTAIFTAECSHTFHFPCIATHASKTNNSTALLSCPVCNSHWKEPPFISLPNTTTTPQQHNSRKSDLRLYDDDEPLMSSPISGIRFNPIPESDEESEIEFPGFFSDPVTPRAKYIDEILNRKGVEFSVSQEAAVVAVGRSYETYAVLLKLRAPPSPPGTRRPAVDLVAVVDVGGGMTSSKLLVLKRAMKAVISSLSSNDRLSIVAFSSGSKRLLPLRRMTPSGRRSARRIIDALNIGQGSCVNDALRKAAKVIQDRKERNHFATMILLDAQEDHSRQIRDDQSRRFEHVSSTRFSHLDIPVHTFRIGEELYEEVFVQSVTSLLSVVVLDLRINLTLASGSAEIAAVYSCTGRPGLLSPGPAKLGDLYTDENRELLIELKVPSTSLGSRQILSVRSSYKDPSTNHPIHGGEESIMVPRPHAIRSSDPSIQRLRGLFVMSRAVAESRRLLSLRNDLAGAERLLGSARAVLSQPGMKLAAVEEFKRRVEAELAEVRWRRQNQPEQDKRRRDSREKLSCCVVDEKGEPLTPTSAWKAAERLAKVAIMRKSLNRVSDLHGFEDARF